MTRGKWIAVIVIGLAALLAGSVVFRHLNRISRQANEGMPVSSASSYVPPATDQGIDTATSTPMEPAPEPLTPLIPFDPKVPKVGQDYGEWRLASFEEHDGSTGPDEPFFGYQAKFTGDMTLTGHYERAGDEALGGGVFPGTTFFEPDIASCLRLPGEIGVDGAGGAHDGHEHCTIVFSWYQDPTFDSVLRSTSGDMKIRVLSMTLNRVDGPHVTDSAEVASILSIKSSYARLGLLGDQFDTTITASGTIPISRDAELEISWLGRQKKRMSWDGKCVDAEALIGDEPDMASSSTHAAFKELLGSEVRADDLSSALAHEVNRHLDWVCRDGARTYVVMDGSVVGRVVNVWSDRAKKMEPAFRWSQPVHGIYLDALVIRHDLLPDGRTVVNFMSGDGGTAYWNYFALDEQAGTAELIEFCRIDSGEKENHYDCAGLYKP